MSVWTSTITSKGMRLINNTIVGKGITITRAVSGTSSVDVTAIGQQTAIDQVVQNLELQQSKMTDNDTIEIPVILSNKDLKEKYNLRQVGIYAVDPDEGEILFAIAQIDEAKRIPAEVESPGFSIEFIFSFKLSGNAEVKIESPNSFVTMESVEILVNRHADNKENPHGVTAAQIGAITPKEAEDLVKVHSDKKDNPHGVTAAQVGLGNVPNVATNDQTPTYTAPSTLSTLTSGEKFSTAMGKISKAVSSLISHITSKNNPHEVTATQLGLGNVQNVSTNDQTPTYTEASSDSTLTSGEKLSVAMGKIAKAVSSLISHLANTSNPHNVTKNQIGLGNVNNTKDEDKPISTATQAALDKKADATAVSLLDTNKANAADLTSHTGNKSNPHGVTATQVGLGNVPNVATNDQTPTYTAASSNAELSSGEKLSVSMGKIAKAISSLISHLADKNNPHNVTKNQLGLGNVNNTSDADKPISTATQAALNNKADSTAVSLLDSNKANASDLTSHTGNKSNPHGVTAAQVGLGNVPNVATNDQTPTYTAASSNTALTSGEKLSVAMGKIAKAISSLISHLADKNNPHGVTKSQIGLGNVNNTSDADKPISTATQAAITAHTGNTNNPHGVTAAQVGAIPVIMANSADYDMDAILKSGSHLAFYRTGEATLNTPYKLGKTDLYSITIMSYASSSDYGHQIAYVSGGTVLQRFNNAGVISEWGKNYSEIFKPTASDIGLGNVPNVATNDQTPTYTAASSNTALTSGEKLSVAMGKIAKAVSSLISHLANTSNPHSVTKSQVGLGNVNNTSDANKPISTATQTALDNKANASDLTSHTGNKSNPHGVTAAQVGAVPTTGGSYTGNVTVEKNTYPTLKTTATSTGTCAMISDYGDAAVFETRNASEDNTNRRRLTLRNTKNASPDIADALVLGDTVNGSGTNYVIYGEHNKPITNNTSSKTVSGTNLPTCNTVNYHVASRLNRTDSVNTANTSYTTYMARAVALVTAKPSSMNNGSIAFVYD